MSGTGQGMDSIRYHLKIDQVVGEARRSDHKDELELLSWSWGETQTSPFTADAKKVTGNVNIQNFSFRSACSSASSQLLLYCACAKPLKSAVLTCERTKRSGVHIYLTVTLSNVMVASYEISSEPDSEMPIDEVELRFNKIEFKYVPLKPDDSLGPQFLSTWDLTTNR